jgi:hypothetical protein
MGAEVKGLLQLTALRLRLRIERRPTPPAILGAEILNAIEVPMPAYLLLIVAVLSRFIPHAPWFNFTAVGGSLLYFGARRSWREMLVPMAAFMATDYVLTAFYYHYDFYVSANVVTWLWYAAAMVLGRILLRDKTSFVRVASAVIVGPTSFFLVSNFAVWIGSNMYAHTLAGLGDCYVAALAFHGYENDLISTAIVAGLAFGVPALVRRNSAAQAAPVLR